MSMRIAFASSDGYKIDLHFGRTQKFYIAEILGDEYEIIENRSIVAVYHEKGDNHFDCILRMLDDCKAIVVADIGKYAAEYMIEHGLRIFKAQGSPIENVISYLVRNIVWKSEISKSEIERQM